MNTASLLHYPVALAKHVTPNVLNTGVLHYLLRALLDTTGIRCDTFYMACFTPTYANPLHQNLTKTEFCFGRSLSRSDLCLAFRHQKIKAGICWHSIPFMSEKQCPTLSHTLRPGCKTSSSFSGFSSDGVFGICGTCGFAISKFSDSHNFRNFRNLSNPFPIPFHLSIALPCKARLQVASSPRIMAIFAFSTKECKGLSKNGYDTRQLF